MGHSPAVSTFAGLAGAKLIVFVSPQSHCWRWHRAFQEPSGEGQFNLKDLFSFKKFPKAQVIAQKGRDSINFDLVCCSLSSAAFIIILVSALVLKLQTSRGGYMSNISEIWKDMLILRNQILMFKRKSRTDFS